MSYKNMSAFDQQKRTVLSSVDLSRKGSVDEPIRQLISYLNEHNDFGESFFNACIIFRLLDPQLCPKKME